MPIYEFDCADCGARFQEMVAAGATAPCPACGGERVTRAYSPIAPPGLGVDLTGKAAAESNARRAEREAQRKERLSDERKKRRG
jgi:putative FmdB family regulatory protein